MSRNVKLCFLAPVIVLCSLTATGCGEYTPNQLGFGMKSSTEIAMIRIDHPGARKSFYAMGPIGNFYYQPTDGMPDMSAVPKSMAIFPPDPSTSPTDPRTPHVVIVDGWVYLVGDDPDVVTDSVAAGAQGCEVLVKRDGDDWNFYFVKKTFGDVNGRVRVKKGTGDISGIKTRQFVTAHLNRATREVTLTGPFDFDPHKVGFDAARDEYKARPH